MNKFDVNYSYNDGTWHVSVGNPIQHLEEQWFDLRQGLDLVVYESTDWWKRGRDCLVIEYVKDADSRSNLPGFRLVQYAVLLTKDQDGDGVLFVDGEEVRRFAGHRPDSYFNRTAAQYIQCAHCGSWMLQSLFDNDEEQATCTTCGTLLRLEVVWEYEGDDPDHDEYLADFAEYETVVVNQ